ncbi:hypothetical protein Q763_16660 [Flavobacterium beibuense F44-8]|uniref:Uncharacterized protein n=1 Tax=Flavobacterium beibuense F44-8 TaxID=1406840 RepID=A0A0A2LI09_9FLAO|nr:hypothetical protein [Flavobacterium beibuense]KGO78818.1 hypothetical protein Q763_16660 [Flavobacterium beibuense F44-8]
MDSKQINFFIVPEDYPAINDFLKRHNCKIFVNNYIVNNKNPVFKLPETEEEIFQVYISNDEFLNEIFIYDSGKSKYYDIIKSNLIEFTIGGFYPYDKTSLQRARLYVKLGYYEDTDYLKKREEFINWSHSLLKDFNKVFLKKFREEKLVFYSDKTINFIESKEIIYLESNSQWKLK